MRQKALFTQKSGEEKLWGQSGLKAVKLEQKQASRGQLKRHKLGAHKDGRAPWDGSCLAGRPGREGGLLVQH